jgi:hypothetical protein
MAAAGAGTVATASVGVHAAPTEYTTNIVSQPSPDFGGESNTADIIVETLLAWGATHAFGIVGDGINSIIEALRKARIGFATLGCATKKLPPSWPLDLPNIPAAWAFALVRPVRAQFIY